MWYISLDMSVGFVRMCPCEFWRQSREFEFVEWNILLWMVLGFVFNKVLYFVMAFRQLVAVCFVVILWAVVLAVLPMLAISSIHWLRSV